MRSTAASWSGANVLIAIPFISTLVSAGASRSSTLINNSTAAYLTQVPGSSGECAKKKQQRDVELFPQSSAHPRVD